MKQTARWMAIALAALGAACGEGSGSNGGVGPTAPRLVGTTTRVTVSCPTQMEYRTTGTCTAYGYDANGTFTNSNVTSWSSSNTTLATIGSTGVVTAGSTSGTVTITAVIDGISGSTTISIVPPLSVTISGPGTVRPNLECYYYATVSYGQSPYTYSWTQTAGSGSSDGNIGYFATSSTSYTLRVTVTDAAGHTASASKFVTVSSSAPQCPQ